MKAHDSNFCERCSYYWKEPFEERPHCYYHAWEAWDVEGRYAPCADDEDVSDSPDSWEEDDPLDLLPDFVWVWANEANALIHSVGGNLYRVEAPYDSFEDMTYDELLAFCTEELAQMEEEGDLR